MDFEFDDSKSEANVLKHGIDFVKAQLLWVDSDRLEVPARTQGEPRSMMIGKIDDKHWSAVFTMRDDKVRIISVRRSRKLEINEYEK